MKTDNSRGCTCHSLYRFNVKLEIKSQLTDGTTTPLSTNSTTYPVCFLFFFLALTLIIGIEHYFGGKLVMGFNNAAPWSSAAGEIQGTLVKTSGLE